MSIAYVVVALLAGAGLGYLVRRYQAFQDSRSLESESKRKLDEAEVKAKEVVLAAQEKSAGILAELKSEEKERKKQTDALEVRLLEREESLEKKLTALQVEEKELRMQADKLRAQEAQLGGLKEKAIPELERVAGMTGSAAKEELLRRIREKESQELAQALQRMDKDRHDEIEKKAADIVTVALQRYARSHIAEITTTIFPIENEELKGKIIGREGRNIRALERATGVEFVMDETPDSVLISSFDPYRREVARLALQKLVKDGRIQPAKIEEKVEEAKAELQKRVQEIGEAAALEVGVYDLPKEIIQLIGRLHFRTSYGQNVLTHSVEMSYIAAMMAAELGLNVEVARKGALLHDIGKAIDHEAEGHEQGEARLRDAQSGGL